MVTQIALIRQGTGVALTIQTEEAGVSMPMSILEASEVIEGLRRRLDDLVREMDD